MDKGTAWGPVVAVVAGAAVGWVAGRYSDGCGRRGGYDGCYGGGYGPGYAPGYAGGCYPGYGGYPDRPRHEDKQDDKIAFLMAESAANKVAICKDEKIAFLEDRVMKEELRGEIFRKTCMKPDGTPILAMNQIGHPYQDEPRYVNTHVHNHEGRREGFREGCERSWF